MAMGFARGTYPLTPFLRGRGNGDGSSEGLLERFFGFYGIIHSPKAIRTARDTNLSKSHALPLSLEEGENCERFCEGIYEGF